MIVPLNDIQQAGTAIKNTLEDGMIPVFDACGIEITQTVDSEMIVYCANLKKAKQNYKFTTLCDISQDTCIIKLLSLNEEFASTDLVDK